VKGIHVVRCNADTLPGTLYAMLGMLKVRNKVKFIRALTSILKVTNVLPQQ